MGSTGPRRLMEMGAERREMREYTREGGSGKDITDEFFLHSHSKDLNTLRCQEQRLTKLADMIKNALNELGCEELPSGCDDLSVEQAFIDANGNVEAAVSDLSIVIIPQVINKLFGNVFLILTVVVTLLVMVFCATPGGGSILILCVHPAKGCRGDESN